MNREIKVGLDFLKDLASAPKEEKSAIQILDKIYERQTKKVDFIIKQRRLWIKNGKTQDKTIAQEKIDLVEEEVAKNFRISQNMNTLNNVTEIQNKAMMADEGKVLQEKLKGRFDLKINSKLPMETKISMFSNDHVIFHLHKNRNFIEKIVRPLEVAKTANEIVEEVEQKIEKNRKKSKRYLVLANSNARLNEYGDVHSSDYDSDGMIKVSKQKQKNNWREVLKKSRQE